MQKEMVTLTVIMTIAIALLIFRGYRLIHFYIQSNNNPDEEERKIARKNYIVHLIFFLIVLSIVIFIAFRLAVGDR